jgi:streptogramin lyase
MSTKPTKVSALVSKIQLNALLVILFSMTCSTGIAQQKVPQLIQKPTNIINSAVVVKEPAIYVYDEYVDNGAYPMHLMEDFTGKNHMITERLSGVQGIGADNKGNVYEVVWVGLSQPPYIKEARKFGKFTGPLKRPTAIACDKQGRIYITDADLGQVIRIDDLFGTNLVSFGSTGSGVGQFKNPFGITIDASGRIYVADLGNNRIVRIDNMNGDGWKTYDGQQYGGRGCQVNSVSDIAVDSKNRIYYVKPDGSKIVRIDDMDGRNMQSFEGIGPGGASGHYLVKPSGIAIDKNDRIYVTDIDAGYVTRLDDISGAGRTVLLQTSDGNRLFKRPSHIALFFPVKSNEVIR